MRTLPGPGSRRRAACEDQVFRMTEGTSKHSRMVRMARSLSREKTTPMTEWMEQLKAGSAMPSAEKAERRSLAIP